MPSFITYPSSNLHDSYYAVVSEEGILSTHYLPGQAFHNARLLGGIVVDLYLDENGEIITPPLLAALQGS